VPSCAEQLTDALIVHHRTSLRTCAGMHFGPTAAVQLHELLPGSLDTLFELHGMTLHPTHGRKVFRLHFRIPAVICKHGYQLCAIAEASQMHSQRSACGERSAAMQPNDMCRIRKLSPRCVATPFIPTLPPSIPVLRS